MRDREGRAAAGELRSHGDGLTAKIDFRRGKDVVNAAQRQQVEGGDLHALAELLDVEIVLQRQRDGILERQGLHLTEIDADTLATDFGRQRQRLRDRVLAGGVLRILCARRGLRRRGGRRRLARCRYVPAFTLGRQVRIRGAVLFKSLALLARVIFW